MRGCVLALEPEGIERLRVCRNKHALRLEVELERVDRELATEARLLVPPERNARERRERHVDPDHPGLDARGDAMTARRIAGPHAREEPVPHVVRDSNSVALVLERDDCHDGPEDLLLRDLHRVLHLREHGRHVEGALAVAELAASDYLGALLPTALDEAVHAVAMRLRDERPHLRLRIERVADADLLRVVGEARDELVVERRFDEHARARLAALTRGVVDRPDTRRDRVVEVRVREDEVRALAAELERQPLDRVRAEPHDLAARARRAGERHLVDARVLDEIRAGRRPVARDDVDRARREADLVRELGDPQHAERRLWIRLQDDGAARGERRRELPHGHQERVVPRHDLRADADGLLQGVREERAADRVRAAGDRPDDGREEAEVLGRARNLGLHRGDRLADVPRLELRELLAVRRDRVGERMEQARALVRRRLPPGPVERGPSRFDGAVDVGLARERRAAERLAGRRLGELAQLAGGGLDALAVDEEPVLVAGRDGHFDGRYRLTAAPRRAQNGIRNQVSRAGRAGTARLLDPRADEEAEWQSTSTQHGSPTGTSSSGCCATTASAPSRAASSRSSSRPTTRMAPSSARSRA